ncbi:MAG: hypothetical protein DI527_00895 [Chelatococcus sp.]|nr:MAG: hypothetical protein DI527_00895 [Chelatococcus sp.]
MGEIVSTPAFGLARRSAPAAMAAAAPPRLTLPQRVVLGFLHAGALFRGPGGSWRSRAFPQERVLDGTVRALERQGLAQLREIVGRHDQRRCCAVITGAGMAAYRGGRLEARRPPPLAIEGVLDEVEQLEAEFGARESRIDRALAALEAEMRETAAAQARVEARLRTIETKAARLDHERQTLAAGRADLRAVATQACERLGTELGRAGR